MNELLLKWLNNGGEAKNIPRSLLLSEMTSIPKALIVRLTFTQSMQAEFLKHFLAIRGESEYQKQNQEVLTTMIRLYKEDGTLRAKKMSLVAEVINERINDGLNMHSAMADMFSSSYVMIIKAGSSKSLDKEVGSQVRLNKAIKAATEDAIEISKVQKGMRMKIMIGLGFIFSSMVVAQKGSVHYQQLKAEDPNIDRFIDIPHKLYWVGEFAVTYMPLVTLIGLICLFAIGWAVRNWFPDYRSSLDKYCPPFVMYKYLCGLNIFSGLTLLISYVRYETIEAIDALYSSASKYERMHLEKMGDNLGEGEKGTRQLDTGLLTKKLSLSLKIAGEGEAASVRTALEIINKQGKSSIVAAIKHTSTILLVASVFLSVLIMVQVGAAAAFLFQVQMGM